MRLRNIPGADEVVANSPYCIAQPSKLKGKYKSELFGNDNPLYIEIGMGKGKFILDNALQNPNINYIGIEKYDSVIVRAIQKTNDMDINNLFLVRMDAKDLLNVFDREIDTIYLNFSDPWPKKRQNKRRLTYPTMLNEYYKILKNGGKLIFKSDNDVLFNDSVEYLKESPFKVESIVYDYDGNDPYDAQTEYETKFRGLGTPIKRYVVVKEEK